MRTELRERLASKQRLRLAQARDHAQAARSDIHRLGLPGIGFLPRTSASIPTAPKCRTSSATSTSTTRASPASRSGSTRAGSPICTWPGLPPTGCRSRSSSPSTCGCSMRCATNSSLRANKFKAMAAAGLLTDVRYRRNHRHGFGAGLRPQQSTRGARPDPHQPAHHRRVRDGLDLQGAHAGDGARFRQVHAQFVLRCARAAALRQVHHPRLSMRRTAS